MRVVCDKCSAVYRISDDKLVKAVNRATCKKCGNKIIIYKDGKTPGVDTAYTYKPVSAEIPSAKAESSSTVIKSVPELDKAARKAGLGSPSIGSLTSELRAIQVPGVIAPPPIHRPMDISPAIPPEDDTRATDPTPIAPLPSQRRGSTSSIPTPVLPPTGIPKSSGPTTKVYSGKPISAQALATGTDAVPSTGDDATVKMDYPPAMGRPLADEYATPTDPGRPPSPVGPTGSSESSAITSPGRPAPRPAEPASAEALLGQVGGLGAFGFVGLGLALFAPSMVLRGVGFALAGLGTAGALLIPGLCRRGRTPAMAPIALGLSVVLGLVAGAVGMAVNPGSSSRAPSARSPGVSSVSAAASVATTAATGTVAESARGDGPAPMDGAAIEGGGEVEMDPLDAGVAALDEAALDSAGTTGGSLSDDEVASLRKYDSGGGKSNTSSRGRTSSGNNGGSLLAALRSNDQKLDVSTEAPKTSDERRRSSRESMGPRSASRSTQDSSDRIAKARQTEASRSSTSSSRSRQSSSPAGPSRASVRDTSSPTKSSSSSSGSSGPNRFVIDTIINNNAAIARCIRAEQTRGADVSGKLYLKFSVSPSGKVSRARMATARFSGTSLDMCISKEVNGLKFPPFDGSTKQITYPLLVQ